MGEFDMKPKDMADWKKNKTGKFGKWNPNNVTVWNDPAGSDEMEIDENQPVIGGLRTALSESAYAQKRVRAWNGVSSEVENVGANMVSPPNVNNMSVNKQMSVQKAPT